MIKSDFSVSGGEDSYDLRSFIVSALSDSKAEDVVTIDLAGKTEFAEFMMICSGRSHRHVGAIADDLRRRLKPLCGDGVRIDGLSNCDWVLIDAGDVIVHIFRPEVREFYNLEKLWSLERSERVAV